MLDQLFYLTKAAELIVSAAGIIALVSLAAWNKVTGSRPDPSEQIATEAKAYVQRYGDAAIRRIGIEMHQERTLNGITPRYRYLREISGCLCTWHMSACGAARTSHSAPSSSA